MESKTIPVLQAAFRELYKQSFAIKPTISAEYRSEHKGVVPYIELRPADGAIGTADAMDKMYDVIAAMNRGATIEEKIGFNPPMGDDGTLLLHVDHPEAVLTRLEAQHPDIVQKARTMVAHGANVDRGGQVRI